jgi:circadian clock protein KaiC
MDGEQRTSTGISGLDEVLRGGILRNHCYLLVGAAGTGKTIASLQWLLDGLRQGESALYVTLAEPVQNIRRNVRSFGWDLDDLDILDLNPVVDNGAGELVEEYTVFPPSEVERGPMWQGIYEAVKENKPDRVVIDSVTQLRYLSTDDYQFRKQILGLVNFLYDAECTSFLTYEPSELERETSVALAVDGIIRLRMEISPRRVIGLRSVQIEKLRGSDFMSGYHPMRFTDTGLVVYPHRVEDPGDTMPGEVILSSGLPVLDRMLGGGVESATSTVLSGPAGAGKTTLAMQMLVTGARNGMRGIIYTFEESPASILARCRSVNIPLEEMLERDMLKIVRVNPMELYPDQLLQMIRIAVTVDGYRCVMVDSLRGYELAMEEFGSMIANIHNLVMLLNREGVVSLFINEVEAITGNLTATELGVSYIVDNLILLRYAEYNSRVIRVIACLKKRHSAFETMLREFTVTSDGIVISDMVQGLHGILTGVPTTANVSPPQ